MILDRVARLRAERGIITEQRSVAEIVVAIRNATKARAEDERGALAVAKRRDAIDLELELAEGAVARLPAITEADPSASTMSSVVGLVTGGSVSIAENTLRRVRLLLLLSLPLAGGIIFAIGATLAGRESERRSP